MTARATDLADLETTLPLNAVVHWLTTLWDNGWHPMDIARTIGSDATNKVPLAAVVDAIAVDRQGWHPHAAALWRAHADDLGATRVWWDERQPYWPQLGRRLGVADWEIVGGAAFVQLLVDQPPPALPLFEAPPTQPGRTAGSADVDSVVLGRIRSLLAKAESTEFDHEADAFSAKAQELIARHSIDAALLGDEVDVPGGRRLYIDAPYAKAKYLLLAAVADANTCRCLWNNQRSTATLIGHRGDLHMTEMLFSSLLLQGTGAILAAGTQQDAFGTNTTRSWRNAFWQGFAHRIGRRLAEAADTARADHARETGTDNLPVLAARQDAVDAAVDQHYPRLGRLTTSMSNGDGLRAGDRFGHRADLGTSSVRSGGRRQLSR